jgi:hypothetical protein
MLIRVFIGFDTELFFISGNRREFYRARPDE